MHFTTTTIKAIAYKSGMADSAVASGAFTITGGDFWQPTRMISALAGVRPGEVAPAALEWQEDFQVIRLVRRKGAAYRIESVSVPKRSFDDWFWETASNIPVTIEDKALKEAFLAEVSWGKRIGVER